MRVWGTLLEILADPKKRAVLKQELRDYSQRVAAGADPIEALHGHVCGPHCWHEKLNRWLDRRGKRGDAGAREPAQK